MAVDGDEESGAGEITLEDKIQAVSHQSTVHLFVAVGFLPLLIAIFVGGLLMLANAHKSTSTIVAKKPENRVDLFRKKIDVVKLKTEAQYNQYLSKMDDDSIFSVNEKFEIIYELSLESEKSYTELLENYQTMVYETASRVRGSGEWYYYYEQKIARLTALSKSREQKMKEYFERD